MKLLKNVVILNLDGISDNNGDFFDTTSVITFDGGHNNIPIMVDEKVVGTASMMFDYNVTTQLKVDLCFNDDIPQEYHALRPSFHGTCVQRLADHVQKAKLREIRLFTFNADDRIPTLGSYLGITTPNNKFPTGYSLIPKGVCTCERLLYGHENDCGWNNGKN